MCLVRGRRCPWDRVCLVELRKRQIQLSELPAKVEGGESFQDIHLSKIYIIFVKPFSNNPSPWFPGQIIRGFKGLADWIVDIFLRGGGNPWVISTLSQLLHYPIVGVLSDSAMWPMWFLTPFSLSVTSKVWKAAADDNVILWSHDLDCDCDIVITRLKNHQHNLELVQLHSGVGVWECVGGTGGTKKDAFTGLGSQRL